MLNCLVLTHSESDFGSSFLFNGLNIVLGSDSIWEYPIKKSYHGIVDTYNRPWYNGEEGTTAPHPWMQAYPLREVGTDEEYLADIKQKLSDGFFKIVLLESWRFTVKESWKQLVDVVRRSGAIVVLHDGEDYSDMNSEALTTVCPHVYLKRERLRQLPFAEYIDTGAEYKTLVLPFPFSAPDSIVPTTTTTTDYSVSALLGASWPGRKDVADALRDVPDSYVAHGDDTEGQFYKTGVHPLSGFWEYIDITRRSGFGVSVRGHGFDSCRYTEIAVNSGLLCDDVNIHIPNPFQHGYTCMMYNNPKEAADWAAGIAHSPSVFFHIRNRGMEHARLHHTNSARITWLLSIIL